jgi:flagellar hook-length control protein FliK
MSAAFPVSTGHALNQVQLGPKAQPGAHMSQGTASAHARGDAPAQTNSKTTTQTASADGKNNGKHTGKDAHGKDFPAVFHSMMQTDGAEAGKQALPMDAAQLLSANKDDKSASSDGKDQNPDAAVAVTGLPMFAADTGKGLPQLSWSGYAAVADNNGANALAMQGDQDKVISSQTVAGKNLPNAILKAQQQLANAQLQQGTPVTGEPGDFAAAMNKENSHGLQMAHQFLADNASVPQTHTINTAATTNSHHAMVNDLSALVATTATRGNDNSGQQISVPVQNPQWGQQLGDRVQWMVGHNLHQADIHLNPPELGSLQVHIQVHGDQASVNFSSPHALVRHALDDAIPRLREMMHETGLTLGDVNVSGQALAQHQSRDPHTQQGQQSHALGSAHVEEPQAIVATSPIRRLHANSMLDVYA